MVTSSAQLSGEASSSLNHPAVHHASRRLHQNENEPSSQPSGAPLPMSRPATAASTQRQQQPHSSGPSVVSRYMLPSYRQASSSSVPSTVSQSHQTSTSSNPAIHPLNASLPDILHSHMVPQIPRLRQNQRRHGDPRHGRERRRSENDSNSRHRHAHAPHSRSERRRTTSSSSQIRESCSCKEPCVKCVVTFTSFRWVLVVLSILGVCCVVSGIVLAALHAAGSSFLFLAVMFIGLGILLVIVVSVGWKCTPRGHEPLHALFHIGQFSRGGSRERHRRRRHRHRDGNWFGGVFYPEFQYRRPPPSYAASMQDYNNQSLQDSSGAGPSHQSSSSRHERHDSLPGSPPPSYHSRTSTLHSGMNITVQGDSQPNSRPPTYRSRAPSRRPSLPRHESPPSSQGIETVSDPSLPTTLSQEDFLRVAVVGESVTEPTVGISGDLNLTSAADVSAVSVSYSPTGETTSVHQVELSQRVDESNASINTSQNPNGDYVTSQGAAAVSVDDITIGSNQNGQNVIDRSSSMSLNTRGSSTVVVITNQPTSTLPVSPSTTTTTPATTTSFMQTNPPLPASHSDNFESDVEQLEQALESLDEMDDGIDNLGASISSESTEHYDTHL